MDKKRVLVIGSGLAGLSAAIRLAHDGYNVTVLEKNKTVGGKVNTHCGNGFTFDIGPTLLTMPHVLEELFDSLGLELENELDIHKIDPICRYFWDDGSSIDAIHDVDEMYENIDRFSDNKDAESYRRFLNKSREIYNITNETFLESPFLEKDDLLSTHGMKALFGLPKIDSMRTVHEANKSFFESKKLVQLFDRYSTYNGSNPYLAPATLNVIVHVEYVLGSYALKGGMRKLSEKLYEIAQRQGVVFSLDNEVSKINIKNGELYSVESSEKTYLKAIDFDILVCNSDVAETYRYLIDDIDKLQFKEKYNQLEPSLSGNIMCWGVEGEYGKLALHNIFFCEDYKKEFDAIFNENKIADDPTFYISISSRLNETDSPQGFESWFILVNAPYISSGSGRDAMAKSLIYNKLKERLISKLRVHGIDIRDKIKYEYFIDEYDMYNKYSSNAGSIYGTSSNSKWSAFKRPPNRDRNYKDLYFCGGSSHPGGGIPLTILSGKHVHTIIKRKADKEIHK
ncbi:MAG: phytoene desaturase family protein [Candidatus Kapaibacteriales bacterium]